MAQFLTTNEVQSTVEGIIRDAKNELVLVSPYVKLSKNLFERLKAADARGVRTTIVYGLGELRSDQRELLSVLGNLNLRYYENLHAKCYFNENLMVLTSMNLYDSSDETNREMGVLVSAESDAELFKKAVAEVEEIIGNSVEANGDTETISQDSTKGSAPALRVERGTAFCIRCGERIRYDRRRPHCNECYFEWAKIGDILQPEKLCHRCGKPEAIVSRQWPLCPECALAEGKW